MLFFIVIIFHPPCLSSENIFWRTNASHTNYCTLTLWFPVAFMPLSFIFFIYSGDDFSTFPYNFFFITSASNSRKLEHLPIISWLFLWLKNQTHSGSTSHTRLHQQLSVFSHCPSTLWWLASTGMPCTLQAKPLAIHEAVLINRHDHCGSLSLQVSPLFSKSTGKTPKCLCHNNQRYY